MRPVFHLIKKETLLLLRDWNALVLLFVMPAAFILIMSLALQSRFAAENGIQLSYYLVNQDAGTVNAKLLQQLHALDGFTAIDGGAPLPELKQQLGSREAKFLLVVPRGFGKALRSEDPQSVHVTVAPDVRPMAAQLFTASVREAIGKVYIAQMLGALRGNGNTVPEIVPDKAGRVLVTESTYARDGKFPSSVQQNVPAWLLFAMFFIAIPLSTTWVQEQAQGTYTRLRSMGLGASTLLPGKLFPYVVLNLIQVVLMLLVGVIVVPWFGGDQLTLGHSWIALALISIAASFAAVSYALLVANLVTTSEQATIFTGAANLLMAALGGIMVPRFMMPEAMQTISHWSPMAWGLDGFLDLFLRGGGVGMVADSALQLFAFGCVCLLATGAYMTYQRGR